MFDLGGLPNNVLCLWHDDISEQETFYLFISRKGVS